MAKNCSIYNTAVSRESLFPTLYYIAAIHDSALYSTMESQTALLHYAAVSHIAPAINMAVSHISLLSHLASSNNWPLDNTAASHDSSQVTTRLDIQLKHAAWTTGMDNQHG